MAILQPKNKPTNHILKEEWLDTVLTISDTGDAGTPEVLVDSDINGKISDGWLNTTKQKVTTSSSNYDRNASGYFIKVNLNSTIDPSLLNLYHSNSNTQIVNLDSNGQIPLNLIPSSTSGGISGRFVETNSNGKIDNSFLSITADVLADTIVKTDTDGYIKRSLLDITRIIRVLKVAVAANANYTINSTSQNSNANSSETLKIPENRKDLYVFHNGMLLMENTDYTLATNGTFTFTNGLSNGDVLQIIALN